MSIKRTLTIASVISLLFLCFACSTKNSPTPILNCEPADGMQPDCRFKNPEDIALIPGSQTVLISQYGGMENPKPGSIVAYNFDNKNMKAVFPVEHTDNRSWGDHSCVPLKLSAFSPHGLDLEQRRDGKLALLVVNHGARESVEFFEIIKTNDLYATEWRGCAEGPAGALFNDVIAATDGGFWVTYTMPKDSQTWSTFKASLGIDTGFVYHWDQTHGFEKVPGSDGPFLNGLEKSADEITLFINMYMGGEVRKLNLKTGDIKGIAKVEHPDNITWSDEGYLMVASHTDNMMNMLACRELDKGACGFQYEIVRIDPETMSTRTLFQHQGAPLGGVTVATDIGNDLLLGTFAGDRIVRVSEPQ